MTLCNNVFYPLISMQEVADAKVVASVQHMKLGSARYCMSICKSYVCVD